MKLLFFFLTFNLYANSNDHCKMLPKKKYSKEFSQLVCILKRSNKNPKLKAIVLAQWILESGRGNSNLAKNHYNFGGLTWRKEMKRYGKPILGRKYPFIKFKSIEAFVEGYWHFIDHYPYTGWEKYKEQPHKYMRHIHKSGYTPLENYAKLVISLEKEAENILLDLI